MADQSQAHSRVPDDTVHYAIFPDSSSLSNPSDSSQALHLHLHLQILEFISPYTSSYIWQHEPFSLSLSSSASPPLPHLHGKLRFGDNIEDEWFTLPFISLAGLTPTLVITVCLFAAVTSILFRKAGYPARTLIDSLKFLIDCEGESRAAESVQIAVKGRISDYPERARRNTHQVRVRVPVSVAQILKQEPCLISLAVEGFYDRDIDTMKYAAKMEKFFSRGKEELVCVVIKMSRAMYAQLMQQKFQAPKCYRMPSQGDDVGAYLEAELGMKIACGFEMMYQQRRREGEEGSKDYKRLMENAEEYYRNSTLFSRTSQMMSAPVRRIDEILALPHSADDFRCQEVPPSDDDSWLYSGEDELNAALQGRQEEMDIYNAKHKKKQIPKESQDAGPSSGSNFDDFDLGEMSKAMQAFVDKASSYKGAEVPEYRDMKEVDLDVDCFLNDIESVMKRYGPKDGATAVDSEEGSSSDMDFDESEDESDIMEASENNVDGEDTFLNTYSDALNEELKNTTLKKSFVRTDDQLPKKNEGTSNTMEAMDEEFTPVDVDVNLVKSLLDSYSSQQGQPGPTSNLLGLMGLQLPQDITKGK
ncbi:hypothetical protein OIU84_010794 [Salix udensis]|uniref:Uncharacterized protein n=1 Tax=Salix udensis TaxID=889485 RepID=A0AAD6JNN3_9ROSI|nr:hypothetical protein OIU84_010794 [Salix udensis]